MVLQSLWNRHPGSESYDLSLTSRRLSFLFWKQDSTVSLRMQWTNRQKHQAQSRFTLMLFSNSGVLWIWRPCYFVKVSRTLSYLISLPNPCPVPPTSSKVQGEEDEASIGLSSSDKGLGEQVPRVPGKGSVMNRQGHWLWGHSGLRSQPFYWQFEFG